MNLIKRVLATLVDSALAAVPVGILLAILGRSPQSALAAVAVACILIVYVVGAQSRLGTTVGKRLFRLQVRQLDGSLPQPRSALLRNLWLLSIAGGQWVSLVVGAGIVVTSIQGRGRGLHDRLSDTRVVGS